MSRLAIAQQVSDDMSSASWIRAMFETGIKLKAELGDDNVYDFSLGNPNASPPAEFFGALRECAAADNPVAHRYMNNAGFPETRTAIAAFLSDGYRLSFETEQVLVTCGAAGGMNVVMRALLDPGDEVIVLSPFFVEYKFYIQHVAGKMVLVETDRDCLPNLAAIEAAITSRTRALIVNTPNNPTGVVYSEELCRGIGELLARHDSEERPIYLVADDIYKRLAYDVDRCLSPAEFYDRSIVVSSFSKDLSIPGERAGYVAVHPRIEQRDKLMTALIMVNRTLGFVNGAAFMQRVVAECLNALCDKAFYRRNRDLLCDALRGYGYEMPAPGGAFYVFPRSPHADDVRFVDRLQQHRILAVPCSGFGRPGHFRLSYCVDRGTIERSLPGFRRAIDEAPGL